MSNTKHQEKSIKCDKLVTVNVILYRSQVARLDDLSRIHAAGSRMSGSRSEMLRMLLDSGLDNFECQQAANQ